MNKVLSIKPQTPSQVWKLLPLLGFVSIFAVLGRGLGRIVYQHIGAIKPKVLKEILLPLIRRLQKEKPETVLALPKLEKEIS